MVFEGFPRAARNRKAALIYQCHMKCHGLSFHRPSHGLGYRAEIHLPNIGILRDSSVAAEFSRAGRTQNGGVRPSANVSIEAINVPMGFDIWAQVCQPQVVVVASKKNVAQRLKDTALFTAEMVRKDGAQRSA